MILLKIAEIYKDASGIAYILGRGYNFPVAFRAATLKEISYIHAEGYPAVEMKAGPIALIDEHMQLLLLHQIKDTMIKWCNIQEIKLKWNIGSGNLKEVTS